LERRTYIITDISGGGDGMKTTLYFEKFAPGMKAKLDPTYRRAHENNRLPDRSEIMGRIARSGQQSLVPFTKVKKAYDVFDR
jgi:hypothetical protein